ncbi:MAG: hypothetical protein HY795_18640 [Desulfovibrio sp.]|nr:hypothetical protein [Desulfovibrio sp.]MBI4960111.1 hypothetical protein [Desulfovibrio sp.]
MPGRKDFFDEFYNETMTEMAENFFSRRKEMEARLEGFASLAGGVKSVAVKALRKWNTLFTLLVDADVALTFFRERGMQAGHIPALAAAAGDPWRFKPPFAFTEASRYRKSVRYAYEAVRQATLDYNEGSYGNDPKNPRKKVLLPNYATLKDLAEKINAEVCSVNTCQTPSTVLAYAKSMDPHAAGKEAIVGGMTGEDVCKIDSDMAFKPVDFEGLALPVLPTPPALEEIQSSLDEMSDTIFSVRRGDAKRALACVSAR